MQHVAIPRRFLLQTAAAFTMTPALGRADTTGQALAEQAAIWGLPLVLTGRYLALAQKQGLAFNRFYLDNQLATPAVKAAGPNIDTLYGVGWLDLSQGPVVLDVPATPARYFSIQLIDAYQNVFSYIGTRATGSAAGTYAIVPPGFTGALPAAAKRIDAPTALVIALTRTLVKGPADLPAAQQVQIGYTIAPLAQYPAGKLAPVVAPNALNVFPPIKIADDGTAFFQELDALVQRFPPIGPETAAFQKLAALQLGSGFSTHRPPAALLDAALAGALQKVKAKSQGLSTQNNGWRVNYHIESFNADPLSRAAINLIGPGAHIAQEALYFNATKDSTGARLDGANSYELIFAKGQLPPAKAFWSLILYGQDLLLVANPIDRYAITDRTPDLIYQPDGSLHIVVAHDKPDGNVNWLPAPDAGFFLILRTYIPDETILSGAYKPPAVKRLD